MLIAIHAEGSEAYSEIPAEQVIAKIEAGDSVHLNKVVILGNLFLADLVVKNKVFIIDSIIKGSANFNQATFEDYVDFSGSIFQENSAFVYANFVKPAKFSDVQFKGYAEFTESEFQGSSEFSGARFLKRVDFEYAKFNNGGYFNDALFDENIWLQNTEYDRLYIPWSSVKDHLVIDQAGYLSLVNNYNNLGKFEDADDCYYQFRVDRRAIKPLSLWKLMDYPTWLFYGYGVKPTYPIMWSIFFVLSFGLIYWRIAGFKKLIRREKLLETGFMEITFDEGKILFVDPFLFSLMVYTSGITQFISPSIEYKPEGEFMRIVILERLVGSLFIAMFITNFLHVAIR